MSVQAVHLAWECEAARGIDKLVLLGVADHHREDGRGNWPPVGRLAARCGLSSRATQKALRRLEDAGLLEVLVNAGEHRTNRYHLHLGEGKPMG